MLFRSDDDDDDDSSDDETVPVVPVVQRLPISQSNPKKEETSSSSESSSSSSSSDSSDDDKKTTTKHESKHNAKEDKPKWSVHKQNSAFQRIDPNQALDLHELMRDVSYEAQQKIGATTMWGKNANDVLIKTQGKSFVKAKNKLKNHIS